MWRFNPFGGKEVAGLEGRTIDIGNVKVIIRQAIAEGGFSCVYAARDAIHTSRQYALKHMICNDAETLELVKKEIQVMKILKGHPNVVALVAHAVFDMGRTNEVMLVMEFCEKSLVGVLESRGNAGYFDEKQVLVIFRDVCNAVFAMHNQLPPIAHRDLKVENVLLGSDGQWKLCDFGSTSTKHQRYDKPEAMGIEEDNIRKHTTPAYRAPEMWDLYRREVISEKVDIWALGCLLYRICYLKSAFDGESKLQILNGNYKIPDLPKFSSGITGLIKDMLEGSPDARPDITQVWFRVNELLPIDVQKGLPDAAPSSVGTQGHVSSLSNEGAPKKTPMPKRSPPPPPKEHASSVDTHLSKSTESNSRAAGASSIGSFWSTQHALDVQASDQKPPSFDEERVKPSPSKQGPIRPEMRDGKPKEQLGFNVEGRTSHKTDSFDAFVADFDTGKLQQRNKATAAAGGGGDQNGPKTKELEAEVASLKEQLKKTNLEKAELTSKYEKLSAICRSQRQELHELKRNLAEGALPGKASSISGSNPETRSQVKKGTVGASIAVAPGSAEAKRWLAFSDADTWEPTRTEAAVVNGSQNPASPADPWAVGLDSLTKPSPAAAQPNRGVSQASSSATAQSLTGGGKKTEKPSGWAGF